MRLGPILLCILVAITISGCKDNDIHINPGLVKETQRVYPLGNGEMHTFDYNIEDKLILIEERWESVVSINEHFKYNPDGKLIRYESSNCNPCTVVQLSYENNLLSKSIKWSSSVEVEISTYKYNTDGQCITQIDTVITNIHFPITTIYNWQFSYDSQGNRINEKKFAKDGNLIAECQFEYDSKTNPFFGKSYSFSGLNLFTNPNNVVRITELINNSTRLTKYFYVYDDNGFPTEIREGKKDDYLQIRY